MKLIPKECVEFNVKMEVFNALGAAKKSMSLLELKKVVTKVNRKIIREMLRESSIKRIGHYARNSIKQFVHPETKKLEQIKGTYYFTYEIIKNN